MVCHGIGARRGLRARVPVRGVRRPPGLGAQRLRPDPGAARPGGGRGLHRRRRRAPAHDRPLRDRRRRDQGRRGRAPAPARLDLACAPVGDRVQVPARGGQRQAALDRGQHRPHRPGDAVRGDGADQGGRLDGRAGDPAQRPRGRAQGRPARRHRGAAQGRRRDPRDRRPGAGAAPRGPRGLGDADRVPVVRHHAGPAEGGRQGPPLPQHPAVSGPAARAGLPRGRPRRVRHRGPRLRGGRTPCSRPV